VGVLLTVSRSSQDQSQLIDCQNPIAFTLGKSFKIGVGQFPKHVPAIGPYAHGNPILDGGSILQPGRIARYGAP